MKKGARGGNMVSPTSASRRRALLISAECMRLRRRFGCRPGSEGEDIDSEEVAVDALGVQCSVPMLLQQGVESGQLQDRAFSVDRQLPYSVDHS